MPVQETSLKHGVFKLLLNGVSDLLGLPLAEVLVLHGLGSVIEGVVGVLGLLKLSLELVLLLDVADPSLLGKAAAALSGALLVLLVMELGTGQVGEDGVLFLYVVDGLDVHVIIKL